MNRWGKRAISGWDAIAVADRPLRFFNDFLAKDEVLPVYEVDHSGKVPKEKHTLPLEQRQE